MLPIELIKQIKHIQLKARYLATDALAGEYVSVFKGSGIEFEKVREYTPGDDIRTIDWNVTARMNSPFVKLYHEERELTLMLMIDVSASQFFGTQERFKHEQATELAAVITFLALKNNDKVGLLIFSDQIECFLPPKKGRSHIWHIIRTLMTHKPKGKKTDFAVACHFLLHALKKRSTGFFISDFQVPDLPQSLKILSKRHDLTYIHVEDQREREAVDCGIITLWDAETGSMQAIDTGAKGFVKQFAQENSQRVKTRLEQLQRLGLDGFSISTTEPIAGALLRYFRRRERRARP